VADVDAGEVLDGGVTVTLTVDRGGVTVDLTVATRNAVSVTPASAMASVLSFGVDSAPAGQVRLAGPVALVNAVLNTLVYHCPRALNVSADAVRVNVSDAGHSGVGPAAGLTASATVAVAVTHANVAPTLTRPRLSAVDPLEQFTTVTENAHLPLVGASVADAETRPTAPIAVNVSVDYGTWMPLDDVDVGVTTPAASTLASQALVLTADTRSAVSAVQRLVCLVGPAAVDLPAVSLDARVLGRGGQFGLLSRDLEPSVDTLVFAFRGATSAAVPLHADEAAVVSALSGMTSLSGALTPASVHFASNQTSVCVPRRAVAEVQRVIVESVTGTTLAVGGTIALVIGNTTTVPLPVADAGAWRGLIAAQAAALPAGAPALPVPVAVYREPVLLAPGGAVDTSIASFLVQFPAEAGAVGRVGLQWRDAGCTSCCAACAALVTGLGVVDGGVTVVAGGRPVGAIVTFSPNAGAVPSVSASFVNPSVDALSPVYDPSATTSSAAVGVSPSVGEQQVVTVTAPRKNDVQLFSVSAADAPPTGFIVLTLGDLQLPPLSLSADGNEAAALFRSALGPHIVSVSHLPDVTSVTWRVVFAHGLGDVPHLGYLSGLSSIVGTDVDVRFQYQQEGSTLGGEVTLSAPSLPTALVAAVGGVSLSVMAAPEDVADALNALLAPAHLSVTVSRAPVGDVDSVGALDLVDDVAGYSWTVTFVSRWVEDGQVTTPAQDAAAARPVLGPGNVPALACDVANMAAHTDGGECAVTELVQGVSPASGWFQLTLVASDTYRSAPLPVSATAAEVLAALSALPPLARPAGAVGVAPVYSALSSTPGIDVATGTGRMAHVTVVRRPYVHADTAAAHNAATTPWPVVGYTWTVEFAGTPPGGVSGAWPRLAVVPEGVVGPSLGLRPPYLRVVPCYASATLTGTLAQVNRALSGLVYTPPLDWSSAGRGFDSVRLAADDLGQSSLWNEAAGAWVTFAPLTASAAVFVNVVGVNAPPAVLLPAVTTLTTVENEDVLLSGVSVVDDAGAAAGSSSSPVLEVAVSAGVGAIMLRRSLGVQVIAGTPPAADFFSTSSCPGGVHRAHSSLGAGLQAGQSPLAPPPLTAIAGLVETANPSSELWWRRVTLRGRADALNVALSSLRYRPALFWNSGQAGAGSDTATNVDVQLVTTVVDSDREAQSVRVYATIGVITGTFTLAIDTTAYVAALEGRGLLPPGTTGSRQQTAPISVDAVGQVAEEPPSGAGSSMQARLQALPNLAALGISVSVLRSVKDINGGSTWHVVFVGGPRAVDGVAFPALVLGDTLAWSCGACVAAAAAVELYSDSDTVEFPKFAHSPTPLVELKVVSTGRSVVDGQFTLQYGGLETAPVSVAASAEDLQDALEALDTVGAVHVGRTGPDAAGAFAWRVTFLPSGSPPHFGNVEPLAAGPRSEALLTGRNARVLVSVLSSTDVAPDSVTVTVADPGAAPSGGGSNTGVLRVVVVPKVAAPVVVVPPAVRWPAHSGEVAFVIDEDTAVFAEGVSLCHPDSELSPWASGSLHVTLAARTGALGVQGLGGVAVWASSGCAAPLPEDVEVTLAGVTLCTSLTLSGSVTSLNNALATLVYVGGRNAAGRDVVTVTAGAVHVRHGRELEALSPSAAAAFAVTVDPVDDAPVAAAVPASCAVATTQGTPAVVTCLTVDDVDATSGDPSAMLLVTITAGHGTVQLPLPERYQVTYLTGGAAGARALAFLAPVARAASAVGYLVYTPDAARAGADALVLTVADGAGVDAAAATPALPPPAATVTLPVSVAAANGAPLLTVPPARVTLVEDTTVLVAGVVVADSDAGDASTFLEVALSAGHGTLSLTAIVGLEVLTAPPGSSGVAAAALLPADVGSAVGASVTLRGDLQRVNAALATLVYVPGANVNGRDAIVVSAREVARGGAGDAPTHAAPAVGFIEVWVDAVNDAPTVSHAPSTGSMAVADGEPGDLVFVVPASTSTVELRGLAVDDVDAATGVPDILFSLTLTVGHGSLSLIRQSLSSWAVAATDADLVVDGATASSVWHRPDAEYTLHFLAAPTPGTLSFVATLEAANAVLGRGLAYTPTPGYAGTDTLTVTVDDRGNVGAGGPLAASRAVGVVVAPRNVLPVVAAAASGAATDTASPPLAGGAAARVTIAEDAAFAFGASDDAAQGVALTVVDPDAGTAALRLYAVVAHGSLTVSWPAAGGPAAAYGPDNVVVRADGREGVLVVDGPLGALNAALGHLVYTPASDFVGRDWVLLAVEDGRGGSGGVTTPALGSGVLSVLVEAVAAAAAGDEPQLVVLPPAGALFVTLDVTPVNDAPTLVSAGPLLLPALGAAPLTNLALGDVDAAPAADAVVSLVLTVPADGPLAALALAGSGVAPGVAVTSTPWRSTPAPVHRSAALPSTLLASVTLKGALPAVQAAVTAGLVRVVGVGAGAAGVVALSASLHDHGSTGAGGPLSATTTVTVQVGAEDALPVVQVPIDAPAAVAAFGSGADALVTVTEDEVVTLTGLFDVHAFGAAASGAQALRVVLSVNHGSLTVTGATAQGVTADVHVLALGRPACGAPGGCGVAAWVSSAPFAPALLADPVVGTVVDIGRLGAFASLVFEAPLGVVRASLARLVYAPSADTHGRDVLAVTVTRAGEVGVDDLAAAAAALDSAPFPLLQFAAAVPGVAVVFVDVAAVNDAPTVALADAAQGDVAGEEDVWGPAPVFVVGDSDASASGGGGTGMLALVLSANDGDLRFVSAEGLHVLRGPGAGSGAAGDTAPFSGFDTSAAGDTAAAAPRVLAVQGPPAALNAALATLQFRGRANWSGVATLTATATDAVGATAAQAATVTVAPVDDGLQIVFSPGPDNAFTLPAVALAEDAQLVFDPNPRYIPADGPADGESTGPLLSSLARPSSTVGLQLADVDSTAGDVVTLRLWTDSGLGALDLAPTPDHSLRVLLRSATLSLEDVPQGADPACTVVVQGTLAAVNTALAGLKYTPPTHVNAAQLLRVAVYAPRASDRVGANAPDAGTAPNAAADFGDAVAAGEVDFAALTPVAAGGLHVVLAALNDAPYVLLDGAAPGASAPGPAWTVLEDAVAQLPGLSVGDVDVSEGFAGLGVGLGAVRVTIAAAHGEVAIDTVGVRGVYVVSTSVPSRARGLPPRTNPLGDFSFANGLVPLQGAGGSVVFIAELSVANAALRTLTYRGPLDRAFTDTLTVTVDDLGNTGAGGPLAATAAFSVQVDPVNDAPVIQAPVSLTTREDVDVVAILATGVRLDDVDAGAGAVRVKLSVSHGTLDLAGLNGLRFDGGTRGTDAAAMEFVGQVADLNKAMHILTYRCGGGPLRGVPAPSTHARVHTHTHTLPSQTCLHP
jgi:hypothetical protein